MFRLPVRPSLPVALLALLVIVGAALRASPLALFGRSSEPSLYLSVSMGIEPERRDEFLRVIRNNAKHTRSEEPLNRAYIWGEDTESPNTFHFHEEYAGDAGFEAHQATPHFKVWADFADSKPFSADGEPTVRFWRALKPTQ